MGTFIQSEPTILIREVTWSDIYFNEIPGAAITEKDSRQGEVGRRLCSINRAKMMVPRTGLQPEGVARNKED